MSEFNDPFCYLGGWPGWRGNGGLPCLNRLLYAPRYDGLLSVFTDRDGKYESPQLLQKIVADGTGYFTGTIVGTETVVSQEGTATVTFAAGQMNVGAGTLWSVTLSNGSQYEFASLIDATHATLFDVSGNGRHLEATGFADLSTVCVESLVEGSDWLSQKGWSDGYEGPELVVNGGFDTDGVNPIGWSTALNRGGAVVTVTNGIAGCTRTADVTSISSVLQSVPTEVGVTYRWTVPILGGVTGYMQVGTTLESTGDILNIGSLLWNGSITFVARTTTTWIREYPGVSGETLIDNISLKSYYPATTKVPSSTTPGTDALGNPTGNSGRVKYSPLVKGIVGNCATIQAGFSLAVTSTSGISITGATGITNAGTAVVTVGTNTIAYSSAGTLFNLRTTLSDGRLLTFPLTDGINGQKPTTVYGYDSLGNTYEGAVTTADITALWAGKQESYHPEVEYGCNLADGRYYMGNPNTPGLDIRGNALVSYPAKQLNPTAKYAFPAVKDLHDALGLDSAFYNADGTAKELSYDEWLAAMIGPRAYASARGTAVYSTDQLTAADVKVKKFLRMEI